MREKRVIEEDPKNHEFNAKIVKRCACQLGVFVSSPPLGPGSFVRAWVMIMLRDKGRSTKTKARPRREQLASVL